MTTPAALTALPSTGPIPLPPLRALAGWNRQAQHYAIQAGLIRPLPQRGPHGSYQVTPEDAQQILIAAALASSAGVAVVTMLRTIQDTGIITRALAQQLLDGTNAPADGQITGAFGPGPSLLAAPAATCP